MTYGNLAHRPSPTYIYDRDNTLENSIEFFLTSILGLDLGLYDFALTTTTPKVRAVALYQLNLQVPYTTVDKT